MDKRDRQAGLAREGEYIATTGSSISSPKEARARASWAGGMSFASLCVRYNFRPEIALKVLGLTQHDIREDEWWSAQVRYAESKDAVSNGLSDQRGRQQKYDDRCSNPMRGTRGGPRP